MSTTLAKTRRPSQWSQSASTDRRFGGMSLPSHQRADRCETRFDESGFSMVVIVLSLAITAILVAVLLGTTLKSGSNSSTNVTNAPGVAEATALQAQQTLSTSLTAADAAASSGGYGSVTTSALSASNPSISFVTGPSSDSNTVSVAVTGGDGGAGEVGGVSVGGVPGGSGGSITLADRSGDGTCWLVWKSSSSGTWYGAQTDLSSCVAPALDSTPSAGPVSSASIGWQQGSFPAP
jgi:hypothetical protein